MPDTDTILPICWRTPCKVTSYFLPAHSVYYKPSWRMFSRLAFDPFHPSLGRPDSEFMVNTAAILRGSTHHTFSRFQTRIFWFQLQSQLHVGVRDVPLYRCRVLCHCLLICPCTCLRIANSIITLPRSASLGVTSSLRDKQWASRRRQ